MKINDKPTGEEIMLLFVFKDNSQAATKIFAASAGRTPEPGGARVKQ